VYKLFMHNKALARFPYLVVAGAVGLLEILSVCHIDDPMDTYCDQWTRSFRPLLVSLFGPFPQDAFSKPISYTPQL